MLAGRLECSSYLRPCSLATADGKLGAAGRVGRWGLDQGLEQAVELLPPAPLAAPSGTEKQEV